jgi:hypothetical protein
MPSTEKATQKAILELCQRQHITLDRVNSGSPVHGFRGARKGTSDIIGRKRVYVRNVPRAIYTAIEVKDEKWKPPCKPKPGASKSTISKYETYIAQKEFIEGVLADGGIAGFVRTVDDAMKLLGLV